MTIQEIYKKVVKRRTPIKTFKVKGKTGDYNVDLWWDGNITCDCPASAFNKKKICWHKKKIEEELKATFGGIQEAIENYK